MEMKRKLFLGPVLIGLLALGIIIGSPVFAQTANAAVSSLASQANHEADHAVNRDHGPDHVANRDHGPDHVATP